MNSPGNKMCEVLEFIIPIAAIVITWSLISLPIFFYSSHSSDVSYSLEQHFFLSY